MSVSSVTGYKWYLTDNKKVNWLYNSKTYESLHASTCQKIDQAIRCHHGVVISKDANLYDHAINEVFVLHFVDLSSQSFPP